MDCKFAVEQFVAYKSTGLCQVVDIETQDMGDNTECTYYKLKPIAEPTSTYYVPVDKAELKLREILTEAEVLELIDSMPKAASSDSLWSDNRRERREKYNQIMKSDDQKAMIQLISSLYFRKRSAEINGKRFSVMEDTMMKNAEKIMLQEFGFVLQMDEPELRKFIDQRVQEKP